VIRTFRSVVCAAGCVVVSVVAMVLVESAVSARVQQSNQTPQQADVKGTKMSKRASGTFDVKLTPKDQGADTTVGAMTIDKEFHGDLAGTSKGQMLMASSSSVKDSAGYVAIEKVTGTLNGRRGTFYLQHNGIMTRGAGELTITVIPDSGTDQLVGLTGRMNIIIAAGKHSYDFDYTLPDAP
jgi:uncharacterized protein YpuA (DUF1002 family)